jgi:hypothetical protein
MTLPRWISPGAIAFLAIGLVLLVAGRSSMLRDPGTFWHTRTGELILQDGFIRTDPYTFTFGGTWWVPYQWGGEVVMAYAHRLGGFDAQLLGAVAMLAAVFAWLSARLLRTGLHPILVGAVVALGLAAAGSHFHVRPHVFTLTALAVTTALLADWDLGRKPLGRLFWLIPLFVVWTNVHGGLLGGLATLLIAAGGWVVFQRLGIPSPLSGARSYCLIGAVVIGCGLSMLANPYGTDMVKTWRVIMDEPLLKQIIIEHRPLDPSQPYAWPIFALAVVYAATLLGVNWRELRITWLLPAVWFLQTIDRCRHASLFVVVTLVALAAMWPSTRWAAWLARHRRDLYEPDAEAIARPAWAHWLLPGICVAASFVLIVCRIPVPIFGAGWAQHDPKQWPVELLESIKANEPKPGEPNKLFTDYLGGGFAIFHAPGYKVFVDDRCEVFGGAWLLEFVRATNQESPAAIARWQDRYGAFDFALTTRGTGFDDYFHAAPEWECIDCTATAAFYKRRR